ADVSRTGPVRHCKATVLGREGARHPRPGPRVPHLKDSAMMISHFAGRTGLFAATLALLLAGSPARAQDNPSSTDPLVATVNGTEIHESDLAIAEAEAGQIPPMSAEAKKDYLVQFLTDLILVAKAAEDKNM